MAQTATKVHFSTMIFLMWLPLLEKLHFHIFNCDVEHLFQKIFLNIRSFF